MVFGGLASKPWFVMDREALMRSARRHRILPWVSVIGLVLAVVSVGGCAGKKVVPVVHEGTSASVEPAEATADPSVPLSHTETPAVAQREDVVETIAVVGNEVGQRAPEFALRNAAGEPVSLSDYGGKPLVVVFYRGFW